MDFTTKVTLIALSHRLYNSVILISTTKILAAVTLGFQLSQLNLGWYSGVARGGGGGDQKASMKAYQPQNITLN